MSRRELLNIRARSDQRYALIVASLAGASLALGVVFWIVGSKKEPQEEETEE